jgi:hypothetical protein
MSTKLPLVRFSRLLTVVVVATVVALLNGALLAVEGGKAQYVGGTLKGVKEKAEGRLDTKSESQITFDAGKDGKVALPYSAITSLEYGQKAGRHVGVLFSKKRSHYLTITYKDDAGKEQAGVFELGKDIVRPTLKIVEVRTGKAIEFQDAEACKQYKTPKECESK